MFDDIIEYLKSKDYHVSAGGYTQTLFAYKHTNMISHSTINYSKSSLKLNYTNTDSNEVHNRSLVSSDLHEILDMIVDFVKVCEAEDMLTLFTIN